MRKTLVAVSTLLFLSGCGPSGNNGPWEYVPHMKDTPVAKPQRPNSDGIASREQIPGTIYQGQPEAYQFVNDPEGAGKNLKNPLTKTKTVLLRGQKMFNTYCIVCHGKRGEGDGSVVPKFPPPPTLQSDKVRGWTDGRIFHVITQGQNLMNSYASQVSPDDRWAIVHYIRVLQRSMNPTTEDLKALERK